MTVRSEPVPVEWAVVRVRDGDRDEDGQRIPAGWYVLGFAPGEPEDVYVQLHVEQALNADGSYAGEQVAHRVLTALQAAPEPIVEAGQDLVAAAAAVAPGPTRLDGRRP